MNDYIHSYIAKLAFEYARVRPEEVLDISIRRDNTLVEVDFMTDWMSYVCYIDLSGEVLGFMSEPVPEHDTDPMRQYIHERHACA